MSTTTPNNSLCLICYGSCSSSRNSIEIFNEKNTTFSGKTLVSHLSKILLEEVTEESIHSKLICKKCFKSFDELDELETRCKEIKAEIEKNYRNSVEKSKNNQLQSENVAEKKPTNSMDEIENALFEIHGGKSENSCDSPIEMDAKSCSDSDFEILPKKKTEAQTSRIEKIKLEFSENSGGSEKPNILRRKSSTESKESKSNLKMEHEEIVTRDGDSYTCLLCEEPLKCDQKTIIVHMKNVHELRLYICDVCGATFRKRNELSAHLDDHVAMEEGDFQCEICNRIFSNLRLFRIHKRMHAPQHKAWSCSQCGKKYSSKNLLEEHVNMHTGVRPYICSVCGKDFASKYTFKAHEKTHEIRPRPYACQQCSKSFLSQQNLTQHERTHLGIKEFSCHLCGKQFGSAHNLEVHSIVHSGYKPFRCRLCGKAFARKAEIRDHERTHTGERPYQCEVCGATFSQRSNLQSHKRATHYDDKRHKCDECGKAFKRKRLLDYHVKAAHTGERPFRCNICDATFVYPEHFKKHRRIHTGEKPFMCEVCGKAFNSRDNRNAHRFVHSDKKPYECLVCGAGFMRKPLLYHHMQLQGHLNDTIVVNQPRLSNDVEHLVTVNAEGEMEIVDSNNVNPEDSKLYIAEHILTEEELADGGDDDEKLPVEHIIIDGQHLTFNDDGEAEGAEYEEVISGNVLEDGETQIVQTEDGPMRLVKVRISDDNGSEQEAWVKIVSE